jgi:4'-phosphopantetheinyl transferase
MRILNINRHLLSATEPYRLVKGKDFDLYVSLISNDVTRGNYDIYRSWMSDAELSKLANFINEDRRKQFVFGRGIVRRVFSKIINCSPASIRIAEAASGKPELMDYHSLSFNISHAFDYVLVAISNEKAIGVDVESISRFHGDKGLSSSAFLSSGEDAIFKRLLACEQATHLCQLWTLKEAVVKAVGTGLRQSLKEIEFQISSDATTMYPPFGWPQDWSLSSWQLNAEMVMSFAST